MNPLAHIEDRALLLDGAMGTMIQGLKLTDADFGGAAFRMLSDILVFSRPDALRDIHLAYLRAGSDAVETNTFGASPFRLGDYNLKQLDVKAFAGAPPGLKLNELSLDDFAFHINRRACEIAREAIELHKKEASYDGRPLFVAGALGPSNRVLTSTDALLLPATYDEIKDNFATQTLGLIAGGADILLFETQQDPLELKASVHGALESCAEKGARLPVIAEITVDAFGRMPIFHTDILAALATVQGVGISAFGINCSIGPDLMEKTVSRLAEHSQIPVSVVPNAGLPVSENGRTVYKTGPGEFAAFIRRFVAEYGVQIAGGCCGTTPEHIRSAAESLRGVKPKRRHVKKRVFLSGPQNAIELDSSSGLIRIAERLNVRGSKKVKDAVEGGDEIAFEVLETVANEQVRELGAPILDVCMDSNQVNTEEVLQSVIRRLTSDFPGAMCLDSFSVEALLAAVRVYPGRPIINSISLEEYAPGLDKVDAVVAKTREHDPVYVVLATGPNGPGVTAEEKFELIRRIFEKCRDKYGLRPDQFLMDVNAFPIGSESAEGMNFASETLRAIPLVKALHPDIRTSLGVGNLTTGLGKKPYMRKLLTSVFVHEARAAGLDAAIINPEHYAPVDALEPGDVALARKVIHDRDMEAFARLEEIAEAKTKKGAGPAKPVAYDELSPAERVCSKIKDGFKERLPGRVATGGFGYDYRDAIVLDVAKALEGLQPLSFVNDHLMAAMKELGDGFGRGEVSLPHLLKSADVMREAMGYIEARIKFESGEDAAPAVKGTVVLGTVYQDVHSIGKDLVKTLLENYGYRVIDLGVQTPPESFVEAARLHNADAVGLSALLVQTSNHMITVARLLKEAGLSGVDILVGGAPVNRRHAAYVALHGETALAKMLPNVFYCATAMDGVNTLNQLHESPERRLSLYDANLKNLAWHFEHAARRHAEEEGLLAALPRRGIETAGLVRDSAVFSGPHLVLMTMAEVRPFLDRKTLFSLNWRFGGRSSWAKRGESEESLDRRLNEWIAACDEKLWLAPMGLSAVFPCQGHGDELIVYDPDDPARERGRIPFAPVIGAGKKDVFSVAQYFHPRASGLMDAVGLEISTAGLSVQAELERFKRAGDSESAHFLQGLADRTAEDMAEYLHGGLRVRLGLKPGEGCRYSPGYPALQDIQVNRFIADLLNAPKQLGIRLTDAGEFDPPGTTAAVVCFHPKAAYD